MPQSPPSQFGWPRAYAARFAAFATVGVANTVLSVVVYEVLCFWAPYWLAYTAAFVAVYVFSLAANSGLVFRTRVTSTSALYYLAVYVLNYAIGLGIVTALVEWFKAPPQLAPIGAFVVLALFNFLGTQFALTRTAK